MHRRNREQTGKPKQSKQYSDTVTFLLHIPVDVWLKFTETVPISRTRHDFIIELLLRRIWEYEKATRNVG